MPYIQPLSSPSFVSFHFISFPLLSSPLLSSPVVLFRTSVVRRRSAFQQGPARVWRAAFGVNLIRHQSPALNDTRGETGHLRTSRDVETQYTRAHLSAAACCREMHGLGTYGWTAVDLFRPTTCLRCLPDASVHGAACLPAMLIRHVHANLSHSCPFCPD